VNLLVNTVRAALTALLLVAGPVAAQKVTLERDSTLYGEPRLESTQVAQLRQGASGEVIAKQGAWLNLKTTAGTGWLFSFNVRFQSDSAEGSSSGSGSGSALGRVFGPRQRVSVTSTIGVRGIEEEDLKEATFNAEQIKLLDGYVATKDAAEKGARGAGLSRVSVDYLDAKK
jgi:hypothetical protein